MDKLLYCVLVASAGLSSSVRGDPVLITAPATVGPTDTVITPTAGGSPVPLAIAEITVSGTTLTMNGRHTVASLSLTHGAGNAPARLTHSPHVVHDYSADGSDVVSGLELHVNTYLHIEQPGVGYPASSIDVSGRGFGSDDGPGAGVATTWSGSGASHGGAGSVGAASETRACYGSWINPAQLGSGGAKALISGVPGGAGGGAVHLEVDGELSIGGIIAANGENGTSTNYSGNGGGGAGGSIVIRCGSLVGSGSVTANGGHGGNGVGGGGGGGRIVVIASTSAGAMNIQATGGTASNQRGGGGTKWLRLQDADTPTLLIENGGVAGEGTELDGFVQVPGDVKVRSGGRLSHRAGKSGCGVYVSGNLTIENGGELTAAGKGFGSQQGPGAGLSTLWAGSGGGYGGSGASAIGAPGGASYGHPLQPVDLGSGGGRCTISGLNGGAGGGSLRVQAEGTITVDGVLSAAGAPGVTSNYSGNGGGGAGGSLWVKADRILGLGVITANGGDTGGDAGGGGGGRIALFCCDLQIPAARVSALGGKGRAVGAPGTVVHGSSSINVFLQPPPSTTYVGGDEVSLVVDASGDGQMLYQWFREGSPIQDGGRFSGAQTNQLNIRPIDCGDGGTFFCRITDSCGDYPTDLAEITVLAPSDYDHSGFVDTDDFTAFVLDFSAGIDEADFDGTGFVDTDDFTAFVLAFEAGC